MAGVLAVVEDGAVGTDGDGSVGPGGGDDGSGEDKLEWTFRRFVG